jgi:hypothetical protein
LKRAIDWYRQINGNNFKYVSIPYLWKLPEKS